MTDSYLGESIPKLGFGLMRLPKIGGEKNGPIDIEQVKKMVDLFLAEGFTYFDTAWSYDLGDSERCVKEALATRYPRDSFWLTDKLPVWEARANGGLSGLFETSLERCGVDYFDLYLVHGLNAKFYKLSEDLDAWTFVRDLKEQGRIKHIGISFHDTAELLGKILSEHPEIEAVQLQINYVDWESDNVQARKCYEVARSFGKPIIVMEPVRGGGLTALTPEIREKLFQANPDASLASWALRFAGSLEGLITVLSGMSNEEQLLDNMQTMKDFKPITPAEKTILSEVTDALNAIPTIPCTTCGYCRKGCPVNIDIPELIRIYNSYLVFNSLVPCQHNYTWITRKTGKASVCIACGQCESVCPQHIKILDVLKKMTALFE